MSNELSDLIFSIAADNARCYAAGVNAANSLPDHTKIEAIALLHSLNELFYAEESETGRIVINANDPLVRKLAQFCSKHGDQSNNPRNSNRG